ncbi:MAG: protein kinase, partial [Gammaproteobacteria bacterium]|nr:protein kinase [Gammaproteobacteria bacterium]
IITIFDIGNQDGRVWISMEYVNGGDLKSRIEMGMTPLEALELVVNLSSALDFAHKRGIVHRDVKPQNILFRRDGTALLSDFGIAKETQTDTELTSTGTILGSPFYMSPEQAEGMLVDGRTDIYSLGVMFYEMLTGERPYPGDTAIKVIMQHIQSPVPKLPEEFARFQPLLERMMAKDRDDRCPSAGALAEEAQELYKELNRELHPSATTAMEKDAIRVEKEHLAAEKRRWRLIILGACAILLVIVMGAFYVYVESLKPARVVKQTIPESQVARPPDETFDPAAAAKNAAVATETVPGMSKEDVVRALQWLAKNSLRDNRLTQPPADNAYYYFSRLLALDPENKVAQEGFSKIAENYMVLAEREFSSRNYGKAQAYIALGLQVDPDNKPLLELQSFIENRDRSVMDKILDFFRGG